MKAGEKLQRELHEILEANTPLVSTEQDGAEALQDFALSHGYTDDVELMSALVKIDEVLQGIDIRVHEEDLQYLKHRLGIHDELPDGELLPCPVCGGKIKWFEGSKDYSCDDHRLCHLHLVFANKRNDNAANATIRELSK